MRTYCNNCGYFSSREKQPKTEEEKNIWREKNKQGKLICPICGSREIILTAPIPKKVKIGRNEPCPECLKQGIKKKWKKCKEHNEEA